MPFNLRYLLGGQEIKDKILLSNVSVTKGDILYGASGYASNAYASVRTSNVIGIAQETVDNSAGSAGDKEILVEMSPLAVYEVGTTGTLAQSQVWTNVTLDAAATADEDDPVTTATGVLKIRGMVSTSKALVSINFASPADA